jgi:protein-tyrosine phosphatase
VLGDGRAADFMVAVNRSFVADGRQREQFAAALHMIAEGPRPLLYHCTGGKDRTGWMTAIVLTAIGVPRETVTRDYLLSNDYHRSGYQKLRADLLKSGAIPSCSGPSWSRARPTSTPPSTRPNASTGAFPTSSSTGSA